MTTALTYPTDGITICGCGCKYWENGRCIDCNDTAPVTDITVVENGVPYTQTVGGIWTDQSALNLRRRFGALAAADNDQPLVRWTDDHDGVIHGYDADGRLVATITRTDRDRYRATYRQRQVTADTGTTTLDGAKYVVEANARTHY